VQNRRSTVPVVGVKRGRPLQIDGIAGKASSTFHAHNRDGRKNFPSLNALPAACAAPINCGSAVRFHSIGRAAAAAFYLSIFLCAAFADT
jgi:hypothetical protein